MKKFLILLFCAAALCFASCANSDDGGGSGSGGTVTPSNFPSANGTDPFAGKTILNYWNEHEYEVSHSDSIYSIIEFATDGTFTTYSYYNGKDVPQSKNKYSYDTTKKELYVYPTHFYDESKNSFVSVYDYFSSELSYVENTTDTTTKANLTAQLKESYVEYGIFSLSEVKNKTLTDLRSSYASLYAKYSSKYRTYSYNLVASTVTTADSVTGYPLIVTIPYNTAKAWYEQYDSKISTIYNDDVSSDGKLIKYGYGMNVVLVGFYEDTTTTVAETFTDRYDDTESYSYYFTTSELPTENGSSKELTVTSVWGDTKQVTVAISGTGKDTEIKFTDSYGSSETASFEEEETIF